MEWLHEYEELAAVYEFSANLPRPDANRRAYDELFWRRNEELLAAPKLPFYKTRFL